MVVVCRSLHAVAAVCCSLCIVAVAFCSLSVAKAVRQQLRKQLFLGQAAQDTLSSLSVALLVLSGTAYGCGSAVLPRSRLS